MKRVALIPARMASRRLPGKPLADLGGLPLVVHVWRRVASSGLFDRVLVATDDPGVVAAVLAGGGEAVLTAPAPSGTHRVALAAAGMDARWIVNVQGDQPLVDARALDAALRGLERAPISTVAAPFKAGRVDPAIVKVAVDGRGMAVRFGRTLDGEVLHHVGIYGFVPEALAAAVRAPGSDRSRAEDLEQVAWMDAGHAVAVERITSAPEGIDTPEQLAALRSRFARGLERVPDLPDRTMYSANGPR